MFFARGECDGPRGHIFVVVRNTRLIHQLHEYIAEGV